MPVRYNNCKVWLGYGLGFSNSLTVDGSVIVANDVAVDADIDCEGKVIIPAFIDAHAHPVLAGREKSGPEVGDCLTILQIQTAVATWMQANPQSHWVVGGPYNRSISPDGTFSASWLDAVSTTHPIVLHADDHHTIWVNSVAMQLSGVVPGAPECLVPGVDVDSTGSPTGTFRESEAKNLILHRIDAELASADIDAISWAHATLLENGVTATFEAWVEAELAESYASAAEHGLLRVNTKLALWLEPEKWRNQLSEAQQIRSSIAAIKSEFLEVTSVKLCVDGVLGSATAAVTEPYLSTGEYGTKFWNYAELKEVCRAATALGFGLHLHTIGDAAVSLALDALEVIAEDFREQNPLPPVLVHVELLRDDDLTRIREQKIRVNLQPLWSRPDDLLNSCRVHVGDRADRLYRTRELVDSGVSVAFGSDWPVSSVNPFLGLYTAVTRRLPGADETQNPDQSISLEQALRSYTSEAAKQMGLTGRENLLPGMKADFLIISEDPFADLEALPRTQVLQTISGGQPRLTRH